MLGPGWGRAEASRQPHSAPGAPAWPSMGVAPTVTLLATRTCAPVSDAVFKHLLVVQLKLHHTRSQQGECRLPPWAQQVVSTHHTRSVHRSCQTDQVSSSHVLFYGLALPGSDGNGVLSRAHTLPCLSVSLRPYCQGHAVGGRLSTHITARPTSSSGSVPGLLM